MNASISVYKTISIKKLMSETTNNIELIVIGASAGGVEALSQLFQSLPADFRPAVLVVIHLPPDHASTLPQLFSRKCRRPVKEAEDKETIAHGTVYIAPADYHLLVEPDKSLSLSRDEPLNFSRPSIDFLFESAALAYRSRLLGIVLTGANHDGAAGLKQIRVCGGTAWVQEPQEAASKTMPQAAINTAAPHSIMKLKEMASRLAQLNLASTKTE